MALLALYPSTQTRSSLSPSQAASLYETVAKALQVTLSLPPAKLDVPASSAFVASYARDEAQQVLDSLIWDTEIKLSANERQIRKRVLQLAENLASSASIDLQILLGLSIAFARTHTQKLRSIAQTVARTNPKVIQDVGNDLVPSFTMLLSADQSSPSYGLYAVRKTAHSLLSFVQISPPEAVRPLAYSKEFILALANMYDTGLATIAAGYGGLNVLRMAIPTAANPTSREPDDWERIWVSTKVALIDAFHAIISCMLDDLSSPTGHQFGESSSQAFNVVFALLELRSSSPSSPRIPSTPFLNQPLLTDYQRTYNLSHTLVTSLHHAAEKDTRLDVLESTLQAFDTPSEVGGRSKSPGALKLLLRSSGLPQNDHYTATTSGGIIRGANGGGSSSHAPNKGKATTVFGDKNGKYDPDLDIKVTQVLDVLPEYSPTYIRLLLEWPSYAGSTEKVIEALLEGTIPEESKLIQASGHEVNAGVKPPRASEEDDISRIVRDRRNVFDDEVIDVSKLRAGKKTDNTQQLLGDRAYIDRMKADILRRVQEMELEDADEEEFEAQISTTATSNSGKGKEKATEAIQTDEDELDGLRRVKVAGDGESESEKEEEEEEKPPSVETILELAYIRDPKLFDRDPATRRSKGRTELKVQTGWVDEQIEGWRIMLERNSKKDKILQKHEFSGDQNWLQPRDSTPVDASSGSSRGSVRGRGRGRGGGHGRGQGGGRGARGGGHGPTGDSSAKERTWKDKHKASRANHNRKRGHDKKMARGGAGPSTG